MEVRLLGPVAITCAGREVALTRTQQRCVLALLAMNAGQAVPVWTMVDRVWGEHPPPSAVHSLHAHVSRLRTALARAGDAARVRRAGDGYRLELPCDHVDLHRTRRLAAEARAVPAAAPDRDQQVARKLRKACALWRGTPLAGLTGDWAGQARAALIEERLTMLVERYRAELRLGEHIAAVGPLAALLADYPAAEPLAGLKMLALYRCGRQADALDVYRTVRARLIAEIGDEPGAELRALHEQILRRDPALDPPAGPVRTGARHAGRTTVSVNHDRCWQPGPPRLLPPDVAGFTGRAPHLATLDALLESPPGPMPVVVVCGGPGTGKTSVAVHWAHRVRDRFPDGQLMVDLRGGTHAPPARPVDVLGHLLHALGMPADRLPAREDDAVATFRSRTAGSRLLIILDDAADAEQVRPLLPGGAGSLVLVTSRRRLTGLLVTAGASRIEVGELPPDEAYTLLAQALTDHRLSSEAAAVRELCGLCGFLPLALRAAAANLAVRPHLSVASMAARLRAGDRLDGLAVAGDPRVNVRVAFDLSYSRLPDATRQVFRLLGLAPGPEIDAGVVAALAGIDTGSASSHLDALADAHLLREYPTGGYALPMLLQVYAAELAHREESTASRAAALTRLSKRWMTTVEAAMNRLTPGIVTRTAPTTGHGAL
jgi:DNA-binding SARP family transcriptional activator